jgi:DNA-binding Xre family transcriptional regulator
MFTSNIKEIMGNKKVSIRKLVETTGLSSKTITKARQDSGISECRLSTLGRIAASLGVKTKRLYGEVDGPPA